MEEPASRQPAGSPLQSSHELGMLEEQIEYDATVLKYQFEN